MIAQLSSDQVMALSPKEAALVWAAALRAGEQRRVGQDPVELASTLVSCFPAEMIAALQRLRTVGTAHNVLLLRGLCPDLAGLPATPDTRLPEGPLPVADTAALVLLAVSWLLGEPFTFRSLIEGRLVEHVVPIRGHEEDQDGAGSTAALEWHVEDGFTEDRCDFFGLLCLRGHPGASTILASARHLDLPAGVVAVLREPRFVMVASVEHDIVHPMDLVARPVLTGPAADPEICFDAIYQRPAHPADRQAAAALTALTAALDRAAFGHDARPGDLLLVDNRRTVHGRTMFQPHYDGTDRWLLRTYTCASPRAHRRRGAVRIIG